MAVKDTGKTSSTRNMKRYGFELVTGIYTSMSLQAADYDSIKDELGLKDLSTVTDLKFEIPVKGSKRNDIFSTLHIQIVENTAGTDGINETRNKKIFCNPAKASDVVMQGLLIGKVINESWTINRVGIC